MAQVQPVDVHVLPVQKCCCCEQSGDCGMSDCALPPVTGQRVVPVAEPTSVIRAAAERVAPAPRLATPKFFALALARPVASPLRRIAAAAPASVPLFKEHCSFRI